MEFKLINLIGSAIEDFVDYVGLTKIIVALLILGWLVVIFGPLIVRSI